MNQKEERAYVEGGRAAWRKMLGEALKALGRDSPEHTEKAWLLEREEAISMLRSVCGEHGDNDWDDNLHLADIIEKHLARHLTK
jgi:predicted secreted protein